MQKGLAIVALLLGANLCFAQGKTPTETQKQLQKVTKAYETAKAQYKKKPKDQKLKATYVKATVTLGTMTMNSPDLGPKDKYPGALRLYREALALDPKNKEALANKKMIEDIYKSMGRPIPK